MQQPTPNAIHTPWNKGKLTGQKAPLRLNEIYAIRVRLQLAHRTRDLALFNLAIDSKLRACDLLQLRVQDVMHGTQMASRAVVMQQKTKRPVQFEITEQTRTSIADWIACSKRTMGDYLFPSRIHASPHLTTRQYARIVHRWIREIGLDDACYGTHSMRRTKGGADLPAHAQPTRGAVAAGAHQDREHGPLSGCRVGRRAGAGRADRGVSR
jgi:integrase